MWANRYFAPRYFNDRYWGTTSTEAAAASGLRHYPAKRARYPLRILYGDKFYIVESLAEEQALIEELTSKPKKKKKAKQQPIRVFTEDEPNKPVLVLERISPDDSLIVMIREIEEAKARQAAILADDEEFMQLLMMVI